MNFCSYRKNNYSTCLETIGLIAAPWKFDVLKTRTLEEKFHIYAHPCIILHLTNVKNRFPCMLVTARNPFPRSPSELVLGASSMYKSRGLCVFWRFKRRMRAFHSLPLTWFSPGRKGEDRLQLTTDGMILPRPGLNNLLCTSAVGS